MEHTRKLVEENISMALNILKSRARTMYDHQYLDSNATYYIFIEKVSLVMMLKHVHVFLHLLLIMNNLSLP